MKSIIKETSDDYVERSPLPSVLPTCPLHQPPYLYTTEELNRLLAATEHLTTSLSPLQASTFRTLILVLYGTGVRISEALALTLSDVQLADRLLLVRNSKFGKTRLVPTGPKLTAQLAAYAQQRHHLPRPAEDASAFFATRAGKPLRYGRVYRVFCQLRTWAGISRHDGARSQPGIHDLRHTAAVDRVVAWYRQGADVQRLLPQLATYLGHGDLSGTQHYLTMTADLLHEASYRDTLVLLLPFVSQEIKRPLDQLAIDQLSPAVVQRFLGHLEQQRGCSVATRNQRLSAIHALVRFIVSNWEGQNPRLYRASGF